MFTQTSLTPPRAVLFDLDGTLLDTAPDLGAALNAVLRAEQRPEVTAKEYTPLASHGSVRLLKHAFGEEFDARQEELRRAFLTAYSTAIAKHTRLFDGVSHLLNKLVEQQIAVAIVTNKPSALTNQLLPYFPQLAAIEVVVSGDTLAVAKPHPEPLLFAAEQLAIPAQQCWYVGDAQRDIEAGQRAQMTTVLAAYGYLSDDDQVAQWGADVHIQHPLELLQLWS